MTEEAASYLGSYSTNPLVSALIQQSNFINHSKSESVQDNDIFKQILDDITKNLETLSELPKEENPNPISELQLGPPAGLVIEGFEWTEA